MDNSAHAPMLHWFTGAMDHVAVAMKASALEAVDCQGAWSWVSYME